MSTNKKLENRHTHSSHRHNMSHRLNCSDLNPERITSSSDPDSEPEELGEIDKELARKMRELKQIQRQILYKKSTIAMKTITGNTEEDLPSKVGSSVRNTLPVMNAGKKDVGFPCHQQPSAYSNGPLKGFSCSQQPSAHSNRPLKGFSCSQQPSAHSNRPLKGFSCNQQPSSAYSNRPLKERVDSIVQQRRKAWTGTTGFSTPTRHLPPVEKAFVSTLNKDEHSLKLRVKSLIRHRNSGLSASRGEAPVKPPPPSQSHATTDAEKNLVVKGFQRFLSVLNEGVDFEMLNRIVTDGNEHPPTGQGFLHSSQTPLVKEKSGLSESDSQRLQCGAGQRDKPSRSAERTTKLLPNQHISTQTCKRNIQPEEKSVQSDNGGKHHIGSSLRSRSPPVVEEKKPKLEQHQEDLQNILKTIGFNMDADDMCKLTERTQKRLYGIESETKLRLGGIAPSSQQHVRNDHSRSSSSTSVSDTRSSSSSRHQHSPNKTSREGGEQTQTSEYGLNFSQRSRERGSREHDAACEQKEGQIQSQRSMQRQHLDRDSECTPSVGKACSFSWLNMQLKYVRKETEIEANDNPRSYGWLKRQLEAKEKYILKRLEQNSDLSLSEGQIGQKSDINTVTKAFQTEQKKMAGQKGLLCSSIQEEYVEDCSAIPESYRRALLPIGIGRDPTSLQLLLNYIKKCIAEAKCEPEWLQKQLEEKKQYIGMILFPRNNKE